MDPQSLKAATWLCIPDSFAQFYLDERDNYSFPDSQLWQRVVRQIVAPNTLFFPVPVSCSTQVCRYPKFIGVRVTGSPQFVPFSRGISASENMTVNKADAPIPFTTRLFKDDAESMLEEDAIGKDGPPSQEEDEEFCPTFAG